MNPYIIIAVMVVIDLITLPFIIRKILKKDGKNKGMKITLLVAAFIIVEVVFAFAYSGSADDGKFYDRLGNEYKSYESVIYYDAMGKEYLLCETAGGKMYFISGRIMNEAEDSFINKDGYLVYDSRGRFTDADSDGIYTDENSNEYYKADEVRWDKEGKIKLIENQSPLP